MRWDSITSNWDDQFTAWDATSEFVATKSICADVEVSKLNAVISFSTLCALCVVSEASAALRISCLQSAVEVSKVIGDVEIY